MTRFKAKGEAMSAIQRMLDVKACRDCYGVKANLASNRLRACPQCARLVALALIPTEPSEGMVDAGTHRVVELVPAPERSPTDDFRTPVSLALRAAFAAFRKEIADE